MTKYGLKQTLRYKFDTFMAKGGLSIFISLLAVFLSLLLIVGILRALAYYFLPETCASQNARDFLTNFFITFLQLTDPGNMAQDITSSPWFKIPAIIAGMAGVVMFSALIAFITNALDQKINALKKGYSKVIEENHIIILGWEPQRIIEILKEIICANESEKNPCVLILSDQDKESIDDYLSINLPNTKNTRVVTRCGNISSIVNMKMASVDLCKSIIILATCDENESLEEKKKSDALVIKTVLAVFASVKQRTKKHNIIVEIFNPLLRNIIKDISPDEITIIDTADILAKVIVQTSRSLGLSMVYNEIFSFHGAEMYLYHALWQKKKFSELAYYFKDGIPIAVRNSNGKILLNPSLHYEMKDDDNILILANDDSSIKFQKIEYKQIGFDKIPGQRLVPSIERELIIGWTSKAKIILKQYADYVLKDSIIDIMIKNPDKEIQDDISSLQSELKDIQIRIIDKDPRNKENLINIEPYNYDNIIILRSVNEHISAEHADSENIAVLLLLRDIMKNTSDKKTKLITEVYESNNHEIIAYTGVNDLIISNRLISMLMAQVSENRDIMNVFEVLLEEAGSEIYIKPLHLYFSSFPANKRYIDMIEAAQQRQEICLGIKLKKFEKDINKNFGVKLIPDKNQLFELSVNDCLVVLAKNET